MSIYFTFALAVFLLTSVRAGRVVLALDALQLGAQPLQVGILAATFSVLPMLCSWQAGKLADRYGSRWPLMLGAACGACGIAVPYFHPELPALYVAAAMNGFAFAFYNVALQNLVGLQAPPGRRVQHFNNFGLVQSVVFFFAPLLAGFSIDHMGFGASFLSLALITVAPVLMLAVWGAELPKRAPEAPAKAGAVALGDGLPQWRVLAISSLSVTGIDLYMFYMPIYGHGLGFSASTIGVVLALFSGAGFVMRALMTRVLSRFSEGQVLAAAFYVGAASLMLVPLFHNVVVLALLSFTFGLGMASGQPIVMMLTFSNSAEGRSGEALGLRVTVNHLTRVISPVIFGSIGSAFGMFPAFWINALMLACGGALVRTGKSGRGKSPPQ